MCAIDTAQSSGSSQFWIGYSETSSVLKIRSILNFVRSKHIIDCILTNMRGLRPDFLGGHLRRVSCFLACTGTSLSAKISEFFHASSGMHAPYVSVLVFLFSLYSPSSMCAEELADVNRCCATRPVILSLVMSFVRIQQTDYRLFAGAMFWKPTLLCVSEYKHDDHAGVNIKRLGLSENGLSDHTCAGISTLLDEAK